MGMAQHARTHTQAHKHTHTHTHTHTRIHKHTNTHTHKRIHKHTNTHTRAHIYTQTCLRTHTHTLPLSPHTSHHLCAPNPHPGGIAKRPTKPRLTGQAPARLCPRTGRERASGGKYAGTYTCKHTHADPPSRRRHDPGPVVTV
jgi:hypothetical protein